jgi:hypothetical protein
MSESLRLREIKIMMPDHSKSGTHKKANHSDSSCGLQKNGKLRGVDYCSA